MGVRDQTRNEAVSTLISLITGNVQSTRYRTGEGRLNFKSTHFLDTVFSYHLFNFNGEKVHKFVRDERDMRKGSCFYFGLENQTLIITRKSDPIIVMFLFKRGECLGRG